MNCIPCRLALLDMIADTLDMLIPEIELVDAHQIYQDKYCVPSRPLDIIEQIYLPILDDIEARQMPDDRVSSQEA